MRTGVSFPSYLPIQALARSCLNQPVILPTRRIGLRLPPGNREVTSRCAFVVWLHKNRTTSRYHATRCGGELPALSRFPSAPSPSDLGKDVWHDAEQTRL